MKTKFFFLTAASMMFIALGNVSCAKDGGDGGDGGGNGGGDNPPADKSLICNKTSVDFTSVNPEPVTVNVVTDADEWTIGATPNWYEAVKTENGSGFTITAKANPGEARSHTLVISAPQCDDFSIKINQAAMQELAESLKGSEYIVFQLDEYSTEALGDKIVANFGEDGVNYAMDIWPAGDSFIGVTPVGPSFYGYQTGWVAFQVGNVGWSGGAYCVKGQPEGGTAVPVDWSMIDDSWYFHVAVKGTPGEGSNFTIQGPSTANGGTEYKVELDKIADISTTDWTEIEIPFSDIMDAGWAAGKGVGVVAGVDGGIYGLISFGSSGKAGVSFEWDAMFFYKK